MSASVANDIRINAMSLCKMSIKDDCISCKHSQDNCYVVSLSNKDECLSRTHTHGDNCFAFSSK